MCYVFFGDGVGGCCGRIGFVGYGRGWREVVVSIIVAGFGGFCGYL